MRHMFSMGLDYGDELRPIYIFGLARHALDHCLVADLQLVKLKSLTLSTLVAVYKQQSFDARAVQRRRKRHFV